MICTGHRLIRRSKNGKSDQSFYQIRFNTDCQYQNYISDAQPFETSI